VVRVTSLVHNAAVEQVVKVADGGDVRWITVGRRPRLVRQRRHAKVKAVFPLKREAVAW